jgi:hypothetical protein
MKVMNCQKRSEYESNVYRRQLTIRYENYDCQNDCSWSLALWVLWVVITIFTYLSFQRIGCTLGVSLQKLCRFNLSFNAIQCETMTALLNKPQVNKETNKREPGYLSQYRVWLRTGRSGDRGSIPGKGERIFSLASMSRPALAPVQRPV